ncbi:hypothetical protein B9Z55_001501 [Caenorhabditis nigoni]|uniref:Saposin B-type domain-containing protein n=1 Tax=Caenorhabditis nigoni TaxID=1611254 RepID=A0A2G5VG06_9PELO|nr:hypothetical protein B9Z55_001501 [Caenorhabditis nigoni]
MKFALLSSLLLVALLATSCAAQNPLCIICSPSFTIPTEWSGAQQLLMTGCGSLGVAKNPCEGLVKNADLTSSYGNMYPHLVTLKQLGCKKFCA